MAKQLASYFWRLSCFSLVERNTWITPPFSALSPARLILSVCARLYVHTDSGGCVPLTCYLQKQVHSLPSPVLNPKYFTGYRIKQQLTISLIVALILNLWLSQGSEHLDSACRKLQRAPPGGEHHTGALSPSCLRPTALSARTVPEWWPGCWMKAPFSLGHFSRFLPGPLLQTPPLSPSPIQSCSPDALETICEGPGPPAWEAIWS